MVREQLQQLRQHLENLAERRVAQGDTPRIEVSQDFKKALAPMAVIGGYDQAELDNIQMTPADTSGK